MTKIKKTKQELKRELQILNADNFHTLTNAYKQIDKCSSKNYMASGVTLTIKNINKTNNTICEEFLIIDGLSDETIEAIKRDIKRTYDYKMYMIQKL